MNERFFFFTLPYISEIVINSPFDIESIIKQYDMSNSIQKHNKENEQNQFPLAMYQ